MGTGRTDFVGRKERFNSKTATATAIATATATATATAQD